MNSDLLSALRSLRRAPGYAAAAILTLAFGIGASTAVFSVTRAVLLAPFPFRDPESLAWVWATRVDRDRAFFSIPNLQDTQAAARSFAAIAAFTPWGPTLAGVEPERLSAVRITGNFFDVLGVGPQIGGLIDPSDETSRIAVLSHRLWARRFGADPAVVGTSVTLNDESYVVVGILPESFLFPGADDAELAVPISLMGDVRRTERGSNFLRVVGRLAPGEDPAAAAAELAPITARLRAAYPDENAKLTAPRVLPLTEEILGGSRRLLALLSAAVGLLVLVACTNLAGLALVRGFGRQHDLSVRKALGASALRLVMPSLLEVLLVAAGGALAALALAHAAIPWLLALAPASLPRSGSAAVDGTALAFTGVVAVICAALCGLGPSLLAANAAAAGGLGTRGASVSKRVGRARMGFVFAQVAISFVLLAAATLLSKSLARVTAVDSGFSHERVLTVRMTLPKARYSTAEATTRFFQTAAERLQRMRGVDAAGAISVLPLSAMNARQDFEVVGRPETDPSRAPGAQSRWVDGDYFQALGIEVRAGRAFTNRDDGRSPGVALIDEALAHQLFPEGDAIGSRLRLEDAAESKREAEIVGVVRSVKHFSLEENAMGTLYLPVAQIPENMLGNMLGSCHLVVRTQGAPLEAAPSIRRALREIDPDIPTGSVRSLDEVRGASIATRRFAAWMMGFFSLAAALLAGIGLYGTLSEIVAGERTSLAVRMALGATPAHIQSLIAGRGLRLTLLGIGTGLAAALSLGELLGASLYGVSPGDPVSLLLSAALLLGVAAVGCAIPARRAARLDPIAGLKAG
jgi:putative ABC transport system permease protein